MEISKKAEKIVSVLSKYQASIRTVQYPSSTTTYDIVVPDLLFSSQPSSGIIDLYDDIIFAIFSNPLLNIKLRIFNPHIYNELRTIFPKVIEKASKKGMENATRSSGCR